MTARVVADDPRTPLLPIAALGATVLIDLSGLSADDERAVRAAWRDATTTLTEDAATTVVARGAAAASVETASMLQSLSQRVTLAAIEARRGELWMLHAAGVADDAGRVIALVGPSGRGKTTAALALGSRFAYVSDETVAIGPDGRVWPYRKPLSVIEASQRPKAQRPPSDVGLRALPAAPLTLAAIVVLDRRDDAPDAPVVTREDLGDALGDLVAQSSYLTAMERPLATIAAHAATVGGVRRILYREAESLGPAVVALLSAPLADTPPTETRLAEPVVAPHVSVPSEASAGSELRAGSGTVSSARWSRTPVHDQLHLSDPDRIAVLQADEQGAGMVRVIAGVAPAIWRAADGASLDELTRAAIAVHGAPAEDDAATLVRATIDELASVGLLAHAG